MGEHEKTGVFQVGVHQMRDVGEVLRYVFDALRERGYNPTDQVVGYLVSGDPTYITSHRDARTLIRQLDRGRLLEELVRSYVDTKMGGKAAGQH
ncbi:MAG TPA: IreB family regulatory phosphoprotein [bacterium]|nr:IreB family regulatory phosphoprotein [bacterium]